MAKNRVRLNISGVNCTLLTEEDEGYVREMAAEVEKLLDSMKDAGSSFDVAAVITALSFLDDSKKNAGTAEKLKKELSDAVDRLRNIDSDNKGLRSENELLKAELKKLEAQLQAAEAAPREPTVKAVTAVGELRNPFRPQLDETGLVSFYEKK